MSTFGELRSRIEDELQRPDLSDPIGLAIKDAVKYYESERFYFNEGRKTADTIAGQEYYGLPGDFQEIDTVNFFPSSTIKYDLQPRTWEELERINTNTQVTGRPYFYALYAGQLRLYPIPNDTYRLEIGGVFKFDELSATSDTNPFLSDAESLIKYRAKAHVLLDVIQGAEAVQAAATMTALEQDELSRLRYETTSRRSTGKLKATEL